MIRPTHAINPSIEPTEDLDLREDQLVPSPGDAHRPVGLDLDEGGPGTVANISEEVLEREKLNHQGLEDGLADDALSPKSKGN